MALPLAAARGFDFADPIAIGLLFCGLAVFAAIGALSHERERAFSASMIYLGLGAGAAVLISLLGVGWIDPIADAELIEHLGELAVILLIGSMLTIDGLGAPGLAGFALVAVLLVAIRPLAVGASLLGSKLPAGERAFVAWFGERGIGSLYCAAVAVGAGVLSGDDAELVVWTAIACVVVSIVVHGATATPLSRRWLPPEARPEGIAARGRDG